MKNYIKELITFSCKALRYCLLLYFTFLSINLFALNPDSLLSQANQLYKEKNYNGAIELYDSIISSGYYSSDVYYNLGNAHFKMGHLAPAILNYERAKKLAPSDDDIDFNLRIANLRVVDRVEPLQSREVIQFISTKIIMQCISNEVEKI